MTQPVMRPALAALALAAVLVTGCTAGGTGPASSTTTPDPNLAGAGAPEPTRPGPTLTPDPTLRAASSQIEADEVLVAMDERRQALALRVSALAKMAPGPNRDSEQAAAIADFQSLIEQGRRLQSTIKNAPAAERPERRATLVAVYAGLRSVAEALRAARGADDETLGPQMDQYIGRLQDLETAVTSDATAEAVTATP